MKNDSKDVPKFSWWDMIRAFYFLLDSKRKIYAGYTAILILVLFYDLVPTLVIAKIVDFFTQYSVGDSLKTFYIYISFLTITWCIVSLIRLSIKKRLNHIQADTVYFTRIKGFERLLDHSIKWHDKENTGNKVQKIQSGTDALKQAQALLSNEVFIYATGIFGVLLAFVFLNPIFLIISIIYIAIFLSVQISFYKKMVEMANTNNILMEKAGGTYFEGLSNILTIKTLGVKDDFKKDVLSKEALTRDYTIKRQTMMNNKWKLFQVINALSIGAILYLTGQSFIDGVISIGSIFVIYNYFMRMTGNISQSTDAIDKLITAKVGISRMMPIFWEDSSLTQGHMEFSKNWESLSIENASFKYPKRFEDIDKNDNKDSGIENISLKIYKNEKIGIVGKSGSGKSTFAKIFLGLYEFNQGKFNLGNTNFYDIKHDEITNKISLVLQDSEMFNLSLKENITLMREFNLELFEKSINISQLRDVVDKLPNGVDTLIGEKGYRLSGGERQRIGIARAIYKDPQILVLDEATSSLDSKTEEMIQTAFEDNLKKKTVISIAHRISTLKNVDRVIVFEDGKIVEEGKFQDLSENRSSKFYEIYSGQKGENY